MARTFQIIRPEIKYQKPKKSDLKVASACREYLINKPLVGG
jgi:hypothetical protein